jgi:DNA polymerase-4
MPKHHAVISLNVALIRLCFGGDRSRLKEQLNAQIYIESVSGEWHKRHVLGSRNDRRKRVIFHLDMDAFYASIEQRENPALMGKPVIVGSPPERRGVVCAASYEARKFGVRSAMPSSTAGRLCPHGIFIPPRIDFYREESRRIMGIMHQSGGVIEQMSIDEAYLEMTERFNGAGEVDHDVLLDASAPMAREIKDRIRAERRLTATIGIAGNKFLAKLASDLQKPDGLTVIHEAGKAEFLGGLPVRKIHGVGGATEKVLSDAGIFTIGDLQNYPGDLRALVGVFSQRLRAFAFGNDDRPLELGDEIKSISSEETFERDTMDRARLRRCLWAQAEEIAAKLKRKRLVAQTVQVKVRYMNFETLTRQVTLQDPLHGPRELYRMACFLLAREKLVRKPIRLLGVGVSGLIEGEPRQLKLDLV